MFAELSPKKDGYSFVRIFGSFHTKLNLWNLCSTNANIVEHSTICVIPNKHLNAVSSVDILLYIPGT